MNKSCNKTFHILFYEYVDNRFDLKDVSHFMNQEAFFFLWYFQFKGPQGMCEYLGFTLYGRESACFWL